MKKLKALLTFVVVMGVSCCQVNVHADSNNLDSSELNGFTSRIVDPNIARFAALEYAEKFHGASYGDLYIYNETTYYNLEDQPEVYAFTLCSDVNNVPDLNQLKKIIQDNYNDVTKMRESLNAVASEPISGKSKAEIISGLRKQIKTTKQQLRQDDRFVTVLCGATEEHVPVLRAHKGLPEHLTLLPDIQQALHANPELADYQPCRIHYLGLFDLGYALKKEKKSSAQKNALEIDEPRVISIKNKTVRTKIEMVNERDARKAERVSVKKQQSPEMGMAANERLKEREIIINEKWQRLKNRYKKEIQNPMHPKRGTKFGHETPVKNTEAQKSKEQFLFSDNI